MRMKQIELKLTKGMRLTQEQHDKILTWLIEYQFEHGLHISEMDELCEKNSEWILSQIY